MAEYLLSEEIELYRTVRWRSKTENIDHTKNRLKLKEADIKYAHYLELILKEVELDYIFHLAAQGFVPKSWRALVDTLEMNIIGTAICLKQLENQSVIRSYM